MTRTIMIAALLATTACARQPGPGSTAVGGELSSTEARDALIVAERAFASRSTARGSRDAFLAWLADDAVLFVPRAAPARPFFEQQPAPGSGLDWEPIYAEVSAAGDLGFTTGPYEARANPSSPAVTAYGNFVSIWKRNAATDGWKVALDLGTTNPRPVGPRRLRSVRGARVSARTLAAAQSDDDMGTGIGDRTVSPLAADSLLGARAAVEGSAAAVATVGSTDLRLHRDGAEPIVGRDAAVAALRRADERFAWHPAFGVEAQSGDLGYTYGTYGPATPGAPERGAYVRIWRRGDDGRWRLALDITNPFPP